MDADATMKSPPPVADKPKVLLVEDEANVASMVQDWLGEKYAVSVASTGKAALQMAEASPPDLILQDIMLPDMTGYDVVKVLEKSSRTAAIPVIFLTGEKMADDTVKFIATVKNVKGYVNKPFRLKEFLEKIDLILSHKAEFIVLERKPSTPDISEKDALVRDVRARERNPAPPSPEERSSGKKRGFFRALFSALFLLGLWGFWGLLAAGATAELACRAIEKFTGDWTAFPLLMPAAPAGSPLGLLPGSAWEGAGVSYRINAQGLRDEELPLERSTDSFHVLILGGTAVFGQDVPLNRTLPKRLESLLRQSSLFGPAEAVRVVNGAFWNMSPAAQWAAFERLDVKPDVVAWVVGDLEARAPSASRLRRVGELPAEARRWMRKSRLAGLVAMLYMYGGGPETAPADEDLPARVDAVLDARPELKLMVFSLEKDGPLLRGLKARERLAVFQVKALEAADASWKGLTPSGHDALARTIHAVLARHKDRLRPPAPPASKKASSRKSKR